MRTLTPKTSRRYYTVVIHKDITKALNGAVINDGGLYVEFNRYDDGASTAHVSTPHTGPVIGYNDIESFISFLTGASCEAFGGWS